MSNDSAQKRGVAVGAVLSLIASLFGAVGLAAPASAAPSTNAFYITPESGTSYNTLINEDFTLSVVRNSEVVAASDMGQLKYAISTNRGTTSYSMEVIATTASAQATVASTSAVANLGGQKIYYNGNAITGVSGLEVTSTINEIPAFVTKSGVSVVPTHSFVIRPAEISSTVSNKLGMVFHSNGDKLTSDSPTIVVTVTAFLDTNGNDKFDAASEVSKTVTVNFLKYSAVTQTTSVDPIENGATTLTARSTVTGLNFQQLDGTFAISVKSYRSTGVVAAVSYSDLATAANRNPARVTADTSVTISDSWTIAAAQGSHTASAQLVYFTAGTDRIHNAGSAASGKAGVTRWAYGSATTVAKAGASAFTLYAVNGENVSNSSTTKFDVRPNATYTIRVTASAILSTSPLPSVTFTFSGTALSSVRTLAANGGTADSSGTLSAQVVTLDSSGNASFTLTAAGYAAGDVISISARITGFAETEIALYPVGLDWTVAPVSSILATTPGTAAPVQVTVKDQFGKGLALADYRVKFSWGAGYNGTATVSYATVASGAASANMLFASKSTSTGSYTVTAQLQSYSAANALWSDSSGDSTTVTVNVSNAVPGFRTGLANSYSASISYGANFSWSAAISSAYVTVTGSKVVVSSTGLIFKDALGNTASDSITLPGTSTAQASFYVTSRKAGTYTVTLTAGSATTTSLIVVNPARSDAGSSITWDTTSIQAGKTKIVTGTVVDANGNPVYTGGPGEQSWDSGTASILVTYTGTAGIPVGSMPTETAADGTFQISILTSAADNGAFTLTATYLSRGAATGASEKVTSVQTISVGTTGDVVEAADKKITVGSFKGFIAIYTKGYMGQKLSAKVAGKWLVVDPIAAFKSNDYSRTVRMTGAGYTIQVDLYIDGTFVRSETLVTK